MFKIKLALCIVLASGSLCGMERVVKKLKLDVLAIKYADAFAAGTILFEIQEEEPDFFTEATIRDFVSRGISLDKTDAKGNTVLCKAIAQDCYPSKKQKAQIKMLGDCGASFQYSLARSMCRYYFGIYGPRKGYYFPNKAEKLCGKLWYEQKRKQILMVGLLSIRRIGWLPKELVRMIFAHCKEELPSYCLSNFYSAEAVKTIKDQREKAVEDLFDNFSL